ncbi:hypothetical protein BC830DRAFT_276006 [Chytriomyces sp. MP71]|nr:hypothetical protein BC830DRAFT_276006 [Chytriomyces sp. MP71]
MTPDPFGARSRSGSLSGNGRSDGVGGEGGSGGGKGFLGGGGGAGLHRAASQPRSVVVRSGVKPSSLASSPQQPSSSISTAPSSSSSPTTARSRYILFNREGITHQNTAAFDDLLAGILVDANRSIQDMVSFAKALRPDSREFMNLWKFAQSDNTLRNLVFYKEVVYLEDSLAAQTPCKTAELSTLFTRARNAGLTQPILRFLFATSTASSSGSNNSSNSRDKDAFFAIPQIPPRPVPLELRYGYETLINSYLLAQPPNNVNGISQDQRNTLFALVSSGASLETNVLDTYVDAVIKFLYDEVFARYMSSGAAAASNDASCVMGSLFGAGLTGAHPPRASSVASSHKKNFTPMAVGSYPRSSHFALLGAPGGTLLDPILQDSLDAMHSPRRNSNNTTSLNFPSTTTASTNSIDEDGAEHSPLPAPPQRVATPLSPTEPNQVMLYTKPSNDMKQFNILMDISGFLERKDSEGFDPSRLEYSKTCFARVMDPESILFRDFEIYARQHNRASHIAFYIALTALQDRIACETPCTPAVSAAYTRARTQGRTPALARFHSSASAPPPRLPAIPPHAIPEHLKTDLVTLYGRFIGREAKEEIRFGPGRRATVQSALQQDFLRPVQSDLLDGCAADVVDELWENVFRGFVVESGGRVSNEVGSPLAYGGGGEVRGRGMRKKVKEEGAGFLSNLFKGRKKSTGGAGGEEKGAEPAAPTLAVSARKYLVQVPAPPQRSNDMLYDFTNEERASVVEQPTVVTFTPASFLQLMTSDGLLFKQFWQFTISDLSSGNVKLYSAICALEDQLAAQTVGKSPEDILAYRVSRSNGMTQSLSRFVKYNLKAHTLQLSEISTFVALPPIPITPVPTALKGQYTDIYATYIAEASPVEVSLSAHTRRSAQTTLEQDPLLSSAFDAVADEVLQNLYRGAFARFVAVRSGGLNVQPYGAGVLRPSTESGFSMDAAALRLGWGGSPAAGARAHREDRRDSVSSESPRRSGVPSLDLQLTTMARSVAMSYSHVSKRTPFPESPLNAVAVVGGATRMPPAPFGPSGEKVQGRNKSLQGSGRSVKDLII